VVGREFSASSHRIRQGLRGREGFGGNHAKANDPRMRVVYALAEVKGSRAPVAEDLEQPKRWRAGTAAPGVILGQATQENSDRQR
jgi:hypothetical protein